MSCQLGNSTWERHDGFSSNTATGLLLLCDLLPAELSAQPALSPKNQGGVCCWQRLQLCLVGNKEAGGAGRGVQPLSYSPRDRRRAAEQGRQALPCSILCSPGLAHSSSTPEDMHHHRD